LLVVSFAVPRAVAVVGVGATVLVVLFATPVPVAVAGVGEILMVGLLATPVPDASPAGALVTTAVEMVGLLATPVPDASPALTRSAGDGLFAVPVPAAELGPVAIPIVELFAVPVAFATSAGALVAAATAAASTWNVGCSSGRYFRNRTRGPGLSDRCGMNASAAPAVPLTSTAMIE
jgi:hypothetical protein